MIKAVILDLDDTLVMTKDVAFEGDNEVLKILGYPPVSRKVHNQHWGKPAEQAVHFWAPGINLDEYRREYYKLIERYVDLKKLDVIPENNLKILDKFIQEDRSMYVLTSRSHNELKHMLEPDHILASRIQAFYYKDNLKFHKPDPRVFQLIESNHGWKPEECVYVGDTVNDALAAKGAGLYFIASLESGLLSKKDFGENTVDIFVNNFSQVLKAVQLLDHGHQKNKHS